MIWRNEPPSWSEDDGALRLTTASGTDFWRTTHYGFVRDNGHFGYESVSGDFTARVHIEGAYRDQYDQAGLMVRLDEETWLKCGIEYVDGRRLVSAVVTRGLSDWSVAPLDPAPPSLCVELRRTAEAVEIAYGPTRPDRLLRLAPLTTEPTLEVGVMAASPEGGGFDVVLRGFEVTAASEPDA